MVPTELSKKLVAVFNEKMEGKWRFCEKGGPWYYKDDLQHALDAVGESALRFAQGAGLD